ncbi:HAD family phosphatase [Streptosporangiaceae bacterium NEAU-GS5]|nr:HAD family phosphatase [Streptosporangiaceae bacterium NEAU-GS5]
MRGVLFDMDGLLVDTEVVWLAVEEEVAGRLGGQWSQADQEALYGGSWEHTVDYLLAHTGASVAPEVVGQWLLDGMVQRLAGEVPMMPGARRLLTALRAEGVPLGLVTSSLRPVADAVLKTVGRENFDVIVTADDVTLTKPNPEPYLLAARILGVPPNECAVLEDSPNGVAAATAAGCAVVAVPTLVPIPPAPRRLVARSLTEITPDTLRTLVSQP